MSSIRVHELNKHYKPVNSFYYLFSYKYLVLLLKPTFLTNALKMLMLQINTEPFYLMKNKK